MDQNTGDDQEPDFASGIAADRIPEGGILAGKVGDEPVILTRSGSTIRAFSGKCTHLGAPLGGGLVVRGEIRCPWHHACFSLESGQATTAPAFADLTRWEIEQRGELISVVRRRTNQEGRSPTAPVSSDRFVIVGGGAAGYAAAVQLRRDGFAGSITMVSADPDMCYDRTLLTKDYLEGNAEDDQLPISGPSLADLEVEVMAGVRAECLDRSGKGLVLSSGGTVHYTKLLLATGSEPDQLDVPGAERPHVSTLRSLADCRALLGALKSGCKVVVAGSSFIGLEAAASIRARGFDVTVVSPEREPMANKIGPELSAAIVAVHRGKGVAFTLGVKVERIEANAVHFDDGTTLPADLVVVGIGVKPRLALAQRAGLRVDNGLVVTAELGTDDPDIFAAGDIARWPDPYSGKAIRVEHWAVAQRQGQTAARNMMGRGEAFRIVPFFWSKHFDFSFRYLGHAERWDTIVVDGDIRARKAIIHFRQGRADAAVATVENDRRSLEIERDMEEEQRRV